MQTVGENSNHKHIYNETNEQRNRSLNEKIQIGVFNLGWLCSIYIPGFHQRRMQVQIVGHYYRSLNEYVHV